MDPNDHLFKIEQIQEKLFTFHNLTGIDFNSLYNLCTYYKQMIGDMIEYDDDQLRKEVGYSTGTSLEDVRVNMAKQLHTIDKLMKEMNRVAAEQS